MRLRQKRSGMEDFMQIYGFLKTTLLDFPGRVACTVFTGGCNFRCPYCHNGDLVLHPRNMPVIPEEEIFAHLKKRQGILEGVCISGGEPTLQPDIADFIRKIRSLGYAVKLDTNGYQPDVLRLLMQEGLLDYAAMDIKHCPEKYNFIAQRPDFDFTRIADSVSFLREGRIPYEFRTTVVKNLHQKEDFLAIGAWLRGDSHYFLQSYRESGQVILPGLASCSDSKMREFAGLLLPMLPNTSLRGLDA